MSPRDIFFAFADYLKSARFLDLARHPDHPSGFTRSGGKLPLHTLISVMLCGMRMSVGAELDLFFAQLHQHASLVRHVSAQAFAQARAKLSPSAIPDLNDWLIQQVEAAGLCPRWHGLRLVAADASHLHFGLRASHVPRAASREQLAFGLYLPGCEMMLAASLYCPLVGERQMLFEHLDRLQSNDLLLLDRGYPARWLVAVLNHRHIPFCMRVERQGKGGFACVRQFLRSGRDEQLVMLDAPDRQDTIDFECPSTPPVVRLVRQVAPNGQARVLMTNLLDAEDFPATGFGDLYHQRWRIEEAYKRLKHRLNLEHVTGLSQQAVMQDFAARVLCDNLQALACLAATREADIPVSRHINKAYAHTALKRILPMVLLSLHNAAQMLQDTVALIARHTFLHREGLSRPRPARAKPHKHLSQKAC